MIYRGVESNVKSADVRIENLPEIGRRVVLTKNAEVSEESWIYDEADFILPDDREETEESILKSFDAWWDYAAEDHSEPTLAERVSLIEDVIAIIMEG